MKINKLLLFYTLLLLFSVSSCTWINKQIALSYVLEAEEILAQAGDTLAALRLYDKAITLDPLEPTWIYNRGSIRQNIGDSIGGMEDFRRSIEIDSTFEAGYFAIASALFNQGKFLESIYYSEKIALLNPNAWKNSYGLGLTFYYLGKFEEAILNFRKYDAVDRNYEWTNFYLGMSYKGLGDLEQAKHYLSRAAEQGLQEAKDELEQLL
jgi:tetratricopeptide (TPR) repeat protein